MNTLDPATGVVAILAATERSKVPFYVSGGALVAWAVISAVIGITRREFPRGRGGLGSYRGTSGLLVLAAAATAVVTSGTVWSPPWSLGSGDLRSSPVREGTEIWI